MSKKSVHHLTLVKPETFLKWQRRFIKNFWPYKHNPPGRKPVTKDMKSLVLEMKQDNPLWGCEKIPDERQKINIDMHYTKINKILQAF